VRIKEPSHMTHFLHLSNFLIDFEPPFPNFLKFTLELPIQSSMQFNLCHLSLYYMT